MSASLSWALTTANTAAATSARILESAIASRSTAPSSCRSIFTLSLCRTACLAWRRMVRSDASTAPPATKSRWPVLLVSISRIARSTKICSGASSACAALAPKLMSTTPCCRRAAQTSLPSAAKSRTAANTTRCTFTPLWCARATLRLRTAAQRCSLARALLDCARMLAASAATVPRISAFVGASLLCDMIERPGIPTSASSATSAPAALSASALRRNSAGGMSADRRYRAAARVSSGSLAPMPILQVKRRGHPRMGQNCGVWTSNAAENDCGRRKVKQE
eukprot:scaffold743_cov267-Pinguiococcus_pyrenoidosus.AAC.22